MIGLNSIIGLKASEECNLLKHLSNVDVSSDIDFYTDYANCFRDIGLLKHEYIEFTSNLMPNQSFFY